MAKSPNWFDKALAKLLSGQVALVVILAVCAGGAFLLSIPLTDQYLQAACVEVAVASVFFLALYLRRNDEFSVPQGLGLLLLGAALAGFGWVLSLAKLAPLLCSYLLESASAAVLYVIIEVILRGALLAAEQRNGRLAGRVAEAREAAQKAAEDAAVRAATLALMTVEAYRSRSQEEVEAEVRAAQWLPKIPEPIFQIEPEDVSWSMVGLFGFKPPDDGSTEVKSAPA